VGSNNRSVNHHSFVVGLKLQCLEDRCPMTAVRPVRKAVEHGLPRPEALGQITPRDPCLRAIQDRIDEGSVIEFRRRAPALGHDDAEHRPLGIGQSMAVGHAQL
jgi:hypothetical protein